MSSVRTDGHSAPRGALAEHHARRLLPKLIALEKIRAELGAESIAVPGVVVAGAQSAGKSSVLESLSGVNLPRGETIETRVPLFMSLVSDRTLTSSFAEIATSQDMVANYVRLDDLGLIAAEIQRLTVLLAGSGGHVKDAPIHLRVTHPVGPTMNIIDLPGITHISEDGVGDIHAETVGLVTKYIAGEEMIILAVAPATEDLHNAEAIALARKVDPAGERTLGVITKCDMAGIDTGLVGKLLAEEKKHVRLALGMVGVRNRTQTEVNDGISPEEVRLREAQFFETSAAARGLPRRFWGMDTLTNRIVELQSNKVNHWMQTIQVRLRKEIADAKRVLANLPKAIETPEEQRLLLSTGVQKVVSAFTAAAEGRGEDKHKSLHVCARADELYDGYCRALREATPNFLGEEMFETVQQALAETRGAALSNFLNSNVFKGVVMDTYREPLQDAGGELVSSLRAYVQMSLETLLRQGLFKDFPLLLETLNGELGEYLDAAEKQAAAGVELLNDTQEHIRTDNHYYMDTVNSIRVMVKERQQLRSSVASIPQSPAPQQLQPAKVPAAAVPDAAPPSPRAVAERGRLQEVQAKLAKLTGQTVAYLDRILNGSNEDQAVFDMQASLHAYSKVIMKCMQDIVPKLAHRILVDKVAEGLFKHMNAAFPADRLSTCVVEDRDVAASRARARQRMERLDNALEVIKALPA